MERKCDRIKHLSLQRICIRHKAEEESVSRRNPIIEKEPRENRPTTMAKPSRPSHQCWTTPRGKGIWIATLNCSGSRGTKLLEVVRDIKEMDLDVEILMEMNITGFYTRTYLGYRITASNATSPHVGGISMVNKFDDRPRNFCDKRRMKSEMASKWQSETTPLIRSTRSNCSY